MDEMHITKEAFRLIRDDHPLCKPIDAIQENIIAYNRNFIGLPGITWHETETIVWFVNEEAVPENYVYRAQLSPDNVDAQIEKIIGQLIACGATYADWTVYRTCSPSNLGEKLVEHGLAVGRLPWMLMDMDDFQDLAYPDDGFHIEFVANEDMLGLWRDASAQGFQMDSAQVFYDAYVRQGFDPDGDVLQYIGYVDEQPVTSATLLIAGGIPGLYDISTPPDFRGKGYGTAITHHMLKIAKERGYPYSCVMPSPLGRPIYKKLGFVVSMDMPEYRWKKAD